MNFIEKYIDKLEWKLKRYRAIVFKPLLFLLTKAGLSPNFISLLGIIFSIFMFLSMILNKIDQALIFLLLNYFADILDGSLARYQNNASDKGKFIDMSLDSLTSTLLILGLMIIGKIEMLGGAIFIYLMIVNIIFTTILNNLHRKSSWMFHARAGFLAHTPRYLIYSFFLLWVIGIIDLIDKSIFYLNVYSGILAIVNFFRVKSIKDKNDIA